MLSDVTKLKFWQELSAFEQEAILRFRRECPDLANSDLLPWAILEDGEVHIVDNMSAVFWATHHPDYFKVAKTVRGNVEIDTCFCIAPLGFDRDRQPLYFETMIFAPGSAETAKRHQSYAEALEWHNDFVTRRFGK